MKFNRFDFLAQTRIGIGFNRMALSCSISLLPSGIFRIVELVKKLSLQCTANSPRSLTLNAGH